MSKVNVCDHCGAVNNNNDYASRFLRKMPERGKISAKPVALVTIYVPTHWSVSLPATTKEMHLCPECEELFRRWISDFFCFGISKVGHVGFKEEVCSEGGDFL